MVLWDKISQSSENINDVIKQFWLSFEVEIRDYISSVQFGLNFAHGSIQVCWFWISTKKANISAIWARNMSFLSKIRKICYCWLETISDDVLYNYTKSQKVSLDYYKPFRHIKAETYIGEHIVSTPPTQIGLKFRLGSNWRTLLVQQCSYIVGQKLNHLTSHLNNVETCVINMIIQKLYFGFCQTFQPNKFVRDDVHRKWPITNEQLESQLNSKS